MKSQSKVFIIGSILLISSIFTYTLFFMGAILEESGGGEDTIIIDDESPALREFPHDHLQNITSITIKKGTYISGNLNSLKIADDDLYVIRGLYNNNLNAYEFDIQFSFYDPYNNNDSFVYINTDASDTTEKVSIQFLETSNALWNSAWRNVSELSIEPHDFAYYGENLRKVRIFGITALDKTINIDRIQLLFTDLNTYIPPGSFDYQYSNTIVRGNYNDPNIRDTGFWQKDGYNYVVGYDANYDLYISKYTQAGTFISSTYLGDFDTFPTDLFFHDSTWYITSYGVSADYGIRVFEFDESFTYQTTHEITGKYDPQRTGHLIYADGYFWIASAHNIDRHVEIYQYTPDWTFVTQFGLPTSQHISLNHILQSDIMWDGTHFVLLGFDPIVEFFPEPDPSDWYNYMIFTYWDKDWNYIGKKGISPILDGSSFYRYAGGIYYDGDFWWIRNTDDVCWYRVLSYDIQPDINRVFTAPASPIDIGFNFDIRADIKNFWGVAKDETQSVKGLFRNSTWSSGWVDMTYSGTGTIWRSDLFTLNDYENGFYDIWINATRNIHSYGHNYSSYGYGRFEIANNRPVITWIYPNKNPPVMKIDDLYNVNINVSVIDPEGDPPTNPEIKISQTSNTSNVLINWTEMEKYNILKPNFWNYTFDPITFDNDFYTIEVRSADYRGFGYGDTIILIENNPPDIEILSPSETELKTPLIQTIECNISNEEPINIAQWELVSILGTYNWKNLTYNPTSELWEDTIDLLQYAYGDYYLVINATDDKHNSSLEIAEFQLHPLLTYYIPSVSYESSGIIVGEAAGKVSASFTIMHHGIAMERDFEIYIPDDYSDAVNYYITRGFNTYYPLGYNVEGIYTEWSLPFWQSADVVSFSLDKPKITNTPFEEDKGNYELLFSLSAKHTFTDLTIENTLSEYISDPENYKYAIYYKYAGDWVEIEDLEVDAGGNIDFSFAWSSIDANSTVEFRFTATQLDTQETDWTPVIVGATLGVFGVGIAAFILVGLKKHEDWGKLKVALLAAGIGAAAGVAGYLIVFFF